VQAGAVGFVLKDATIDNVLSTIRQSRGGESPSANADWIAVQPCGRARAASGKRELANAVRMTKREREIIVLIAEAMSNKEIAIGSTSPHTP